MTKQDVSKVLDEIATLLELQGENPFKVRAYVNGSKIIGSLENDLEELIRAGTLKNIKGIGEALNEKITTLVTTGHLPYYEELRQSIPAVLVEMNKVPGLGPKKAKTLYDRLHIRSMADLEKACRQNKLLKLEGFGQKSQDNIMKGIEQIQHHANQFLLSEAWMAAEDLLAYIKQEPAVDRCEIAGSLRRRKETVKDLDFVAGTTSPEMVAKHFLAYKSVARMIAHGETKVSVVLKSGMQADLRLVKPEEFPYAWHHFTGSKDHNTAMRGRAQDHFHVKMNEYGLFRQSGNRETNIPCKTEMEIFKRLGLDFIPPELRENQGEIEAAEKGRIPDLVTLEDLQGTFHCHTTWSDGRATLTQMTEAAKALGFKYLGIADHSQVAAYAKGLTADRVRRQRDEIEKINRADKAFRVLQGLEVDILKDGALDMSDKVLSELDYVVASVHSRYKHTSKETTTRLVKAIEHPLTTMLGHCTGRLLLERDPYEVDLDAVLEAAARNGVIIEINANPRRLDLDWRWCMKAKKIGVTFAINPDAHSVDGLKDVKYGVGIARKGWLTKGDILNTAPLSTVVKRLAGKRRP